MATTTATITIASADMLTDNLSFSTTSSLSTAATATGLSQTTGLARTNFTNNPIKSKVIYRSDDATADGANKVYLKNISATASEYFTVFIDQEEMGRLYAGDWAFFPWSATAGTKETFIATIGGTWAAGETWEFDGILVTMPASTALADLATLIDEAHFPNWTTTRSTAAVTFTAREARDTGTVVTATADIVIFQLGGGTDATSVVSSATMGTATESDIIVVPSVVTTMDLEHMLFKQ